MKNLALTILISISLWSIDLAAQSNIPNQVQVSIDLNTIKEDKVNVTVIPPKFDSAEISYHIPKIIPGTYAEDDYGRFIDNLKAFDAKGKLLDVSKTDSNTWKISKANKIARITYQVNDTYDIESTHEIFSPAGTNIDAGKNIMLNTHGFVGYFSNNPDYSYKLSIAHPLNLWGATSMTDGDDSKTNDVFTISRYAELVENPIMYAKPDYTSFAVNGMQILIAVYSPNGIHSAESISADMKKMMTAQKNFLGKFNTTKKYSVILYLSDVKKGNDAHGFGALEHPTATTVVMPEAMPANELAEQLKDIVSHEFFHIVTPLSIHSKEIQYFDYNTPKMSEHLWLYEGVTEYFANLFQINQDLITEADFLERISGKITNAATMNDSMPFTEMSANVLVKPYKEQYLNVYEKGALIGMCIDIIIREKSNGQKGILNLMQKLSEEYGPKKPFNDNDLFAKITEFSYPEVGEFLKTHVSGPTPISYDAYLTKMGIGKKIIQVPSNVFLKGRIPYITVNQENKEIIVIPGKELNEFYKNLDIKGGDILLAINDKEYNLDNIYDMITISQSWKDGDPIAIKIKREGLEKTITGKVKLTYEDKESFEATDSSKNKLKEAWLKG